MYSTGGRATHRLAANDPLSLQLLKAQEQERRQIARELHDEVGQALGGLNIKLHVLSADTTRAAGQARITESITLLDELLQQVRRLSLDLRPAVLDELGLVAATNQGRRQSEWPTHSVYKTERAGNCISNCPPGLCFAFYA